MAGLVRAATWMDDCEAFVVFARTYRPTVMQANKISRNKK